MDSQLSAFPPESIRLACSNFASKVTVQLFDVKPRFPYSHMRIPSPLGTGVLIEHEKRYILLTASHVLDSKNVQKYGLYAGIESLGFLDLGDFSFVRTSSEADRVTDDDIDNAAIFLEPSIGQKIRDTGVLEFTTLFSNHSSCEDSSQHAYFIHGFPVDMTKHSMNDGHLHLDPTSLSCFLNVYNKGSSEWASSYPESHIDFEYFPNTVSTIDGSENTVDLPEPHGFSGCGVWKVAINENAICQFPPPMVLVAILHRYNRSIRVLRATRLKALQIMIQFQLNELRQSDF